MKKANRILPVVIMAVLLYFAFYIIDKNYGLQIISSESSYSSYYIQNDKVYICCKVTVKNSSNESKKFTLDALMNDDYKNGLLKQAKIFAYNNDEKSVFNIKSNSTSTYDVVFVGDYGGNLQKNDKKLPQIETALFK
jgi:hypothetical protein